MTVFAGCIALFLSGAVFGASIAHWYWNGASAWGSLSTSLLIGVIAAESLHRLFARSQQSSGTGNSAV
jgi:hypothetical protein